MRAVYRAIRILHVTLSGGMPEMISRLPMGDVLEPPVIHVFDWHIPLAPTDVTYGRVDLGEYVM
jgi:hypothetical protein